MNCLEKKLEELIFFLIPIPIFLSPTSPYLLASGDVWSESLSLPIIFFLTPILLIFNIIRPVKLRGESVVLIAPLFVFFIWTIVLILYSASHGFESMLYGFQWNLLFFWILYFFMKFGWGDIRRLSRLFFAGACVGSFYIFLSGLLEIVIFGSLLDDGRMTQNLIGKGQYQLLVYVPTLMALSALLVLAFYKTKLLDVSLLIICLYMVVTFSAIVFTGAREGLLVFLVGVSIHLFTLSRKFKVVIFFAFMAILTLFIAAGPALLEFAESLNLKIVEKIITLSDDKLGGRGEVFAVYSAYMLENSMTGFGLLPPENVYTDDGHSIKSSAHNYYVDSFVWTGAPGFFLIVIFTIVVLLLCFKRILVLKSADIRFQAAWIVLMVMLISNNINVPLRQPIIVPIFCLLVWLMFVRRTA